MSERVCRTCQHEHRTAKGWDQERERCKDKKACAKRHARLVARELTERTVIRRFASLGQRTPEQLYQDAPKIGDAT